MNFAQIFGGMPGKGYQSTPSYFGQSPAGSYRVRRVSGAGKDGRRVSYSKAAYYKSGERDPRFVAAEQQQQAFQQQMQATAARTQADIAKQLKIVQNEKSAVSKMMSDYSAQLKAEAERKKKADEDARIAATTSAANQARSGQTANLQIQPASGAPKTAGTQPFKRRQLQFNPQTYGAVSSTKSGTLNI
jgi:hypothetical protein